MINSNPTPYPEINHVLTDLTTGISNAFNEDLVGVYLFGSLSYGDFNEESSDIDIVSILKNDVSENQINELKALHRTIQYKYPKWAKRIESSYTPVSMLTSVMPPGSRPYYGEGIFYPQANYGNEWIINLYLLYNYEITLYGNDFWTLVDPIKIEDVRIACERDLYKEWEPKMRESEWLDNPHYQSYLVLNLCRILNTVANSTTLSKKKSASWMKLAYPEWANPIQTSLDWHYGLEMNKKEETLNFLKFVVKNIKKHQI